MKTLTSTPAPDEQDNVAETLARLNRTPEEARAGIEPSDPTGGDAHFSPIPASVIRGDAIPFTLGSLYLSLTPLKRKALREKLVPLIYRWPQILQFAASVRSPQTPGIDFVGTAALLTLYQMANYQQEIQIGAALAAKSKKTYLPPTPPDPVSEAEVAALVSNLNYELDVYQSVICDTVWLLAEGTPGLAWPRPEPAGSETVPEDADLEEIEASLEDAPPPPPPGCQWLDEYLEEHLTIADHADLLRGLLAANGSFRGSLSDRFTTPSPE